MSTTKAKRMSSAPGARRRRIKVTPLRLFMWGKNLFTDGHFDAYIVDYYNYVPGPAPEDTWSVPDICPKHLSPENQASPLK